MPSDNEGYHAAKRGETKPYEYNQWNQSAQREFDLGYQRGTLERDRAQDAHDAAMSAAQIAAGYRAGKELTPVLVGLVKLGWFLFWLSLKPLTAPIFSATMLVMTLFAVYGLAQLALPFWVEAIALIGLWIGWFVLLVIIDLLVIRMWENTVLWRAHIFIKLGLATKPTAKKVADYWLGRNALPDYMVLVMIQTIASTVLGITLIEIKDHGPVFDQLYVSLEAGGIYGLYEFSRNMFMGASIENFYAWLYIIPPLSTLFFALVMSNFWEAETAPDDKLRRKMRHKYSFIQNRLKK